MRRTELQDLLPPSTFSSQSRSDLLHQLVAGTSGGGTASVPGAAFGASSASSNSATDNLSALVQGPVKDVTGQISVLAAQITSLNSTQQSQIGATQDNTQAVSQNTVTKGGSGSSLASAAGSFASSILGGGLSPIITGLLSLFGGGSSQPTPAPAPFKLPTPIQYQAGLTGSGTGTSVQPVDQGQSGQVRTQSASSAPQVTIQVNAMDSRSFLDHSEEIANAVKQAILSSNSLNDVIADL